MTTPARTPTAIPFGTGTLFHIDSRRFLRAHLDPDSAACDPEIAAALAEQVALDPPLPPLVVDGHGRIADLLLAAGALPASRPEPLRRVTGDAVLVSVCDGPPPPHWDTLDPHCRAHRIPWHRIWREGQFLYLGPFLSTAEDPGFRDTERRRRAAEPQPEAREHALAHQRRHPRPAGPVAATVAVARLHQQLAAPAAREAARHTMVAIDPNGNIREHRVLPWPAGIQDRPIP